MSDRAEDHRQFVHLAMTSFALALRWLTPTQAVACAAAAVVLNWIVLPVTGIDRRYLRREGGQFVDGVKLYPIAVLLLVALLPLHLAAGAWGVLGVGDAVANLVGRRYGKPPCLGRADRSLAGSVAFVAAGSAAAVALWAFVADVRPDAGVLLTSIAAAGAGAAAEFIPLPRWLDDNLPIAAAAGVTLLVLS